MADPLSPVVPPEAVTPRPVSPVQVNPAAPVAPVAPTTPVPVTEKIVTTNPVQQVDDHVATGNAIALDSFAQKYRNTPEGQAAATLAERVKQGQDEYNKLLSKINPNTPEGRLEALKTYKTVRDEPRYGDALMMYMAGDKMGAMQTIMGGKVTTSIEYLKNTGRMIIKKTNALGQPVSVEDAESGQIIPMQEYAKLGGSFSALENTLKYQSDKATQEFRTKEFNNATKAFNGLDTLAKAKDPLVNEYTNLMSEIMANPGLSMDDLRKIASVSTAQTSLSKSISTSRQFIDSATRSRGDSLSADTRKALGLGTGPVSEDQLKAALKAHGDISITDSAGNSYNTSTLLQLMDNKNIGTQFDQNFGQTQANIEKAAILNLYKDRQDLYRKLSRAFDLNEQIQKVNAQAAVEHGNPLFHVSTSAQGFTDPAQKVLAQAIQEKFNVETTQEFNRWRKQQMDMARQAGAVDYFPEPGELESKFTETAWYKNKQREASREIVNTINKSQQVSRESNVTPGVGTITSADVANVNKESKAGMPAVTSPSSNLSEEQRQQQKRKDLENARKAHTR